MSKLSPTAAAAWLDSNPAAAAAAAAQSEKQSETPSAQVLDVSEITDSELLAYAAARKIPAAVLRSKCSEVTYQNKAGVFKAIGFQNDSGGYELRAPNFKGCIGPKNITTIDLMPTQRDARAINLFEGFFDYLSAIVLNPKYMETCECIVLNSVALWDKPDLSSVTTVYSYLDNDPAGAETMRKIYTKYQNIIGWRDVMARHRQYTDVNDLLCRRKM